MCKVINIQELKNRQTILKTGSQIWVKTYKDIPAARDITKVEVAPPAAVGKVPAVIATANGNEYVFPLTQGFEVWYCAEMLKSFEFGIEVTFSSFIQFFTLVSEINELLQAKRRSVSGCAVLSL